MDTNKKSARNSRVTGAPGPLELPGREAADGVPPLDPLTLLVTAHSPQDLLALRKWIRSFWKAQQKANPVQAEPVQAKLLAGLAPEERLVVLRAMGAEMAKGKPREITEAEAHDIATSPAGAAQMIYLSARRQHPGLQLLDVQRRITDDNVNAILEEYNEAAAPEDEEGNPDPKGPPSNTSGSSVSPTPTATEPGE